MINSKIKLLCLGVALIASVTSAKEVEYDADTFSLVGIEAGYGSVDYEYGVKTKNIQDDTSLSHIGLKLGAESKDYRVFLSGKYFSDSNSRFDYVTTYGAELQYKFNAAKFLNFFIGVNGGLANLKFRLPSESFSRTLKEPYFGGDIGTNIHLGKVVDLEFGGRVIAINGVNTISGTSVQVGNIISGYGSLIFKWQMD